MASLPSSTTPSPQSPRGGALDQVPKWLRPLAPVVVMLAVMWAVEIVDIPLGGRLDRFGVRPRELAGLPGIVFAPFLHAGFGHLIANTVPFLVLGAVVAYTGLRPFLMITALVMAGSGAGMWLFGSTNSVQLGASGLVFGYLTYLLTRGFFRQALYLDPGRRADRPVVRLDAVGPDPPARRVVHRPPVWSTQWHRCGVADAPRRLNR